jgi:hypothetical protein
LVAWEYCRTCNRRIWPPITPKCPADALPPEHPLALKFEQDLDALGFTGPDRYDRWIDHVTSGPAFEAWCAGENWETEDSGAP